MTFKEIFDKYIQEHRDIVSQPPTYLFEKRQGEYTVEDYEQLEEDIRVELIDGHFIYMDSPLPVHQEVMLELAMTLQLFIKSNQGACTTYVAPCDVQFSEDDRTTILQPDVFVICDKSKNNGRRIVGPPDLAIEILSPSTKKKDLGIKRKKYQEGGVREYWIVDLKKKCITVHMFETGETTIYGIDDTIPVGIFDGKCSVEAKQLFS